MQVLKQYNFLIEGSMIVCSQNMARRPAGMGAQGLHSSTVAKINKHQEKNMKLVKKIIIVGLAMAVSTGLAQAAEYTMRISHQFPPSHHTAKRLEQMAKDVAKETNGKVEVQLFGAAQLFTPKQHHAAVASGPPASALDRKSAVKGK